MRSRASVAFFVGAAFFVSHCGGGAAGPGDGAGAPGAAGVGRAGATALAGSAGSPATGGVTARAGAGGTGTAGAASGKTSTAGASGQQASAGTGAAPGTGGGGTGGASGGASDGGAGRPLGGTGAVGGTVEVGGGGTGGAPAPIVESLEISKVWSGHFVEFDLLTHGDRQFAAFYDENRALTIAERKLGTTSWTFSRPGTSIGWDSHNYVVLAVDSTGYVHVSGNMHSSPLNYFRSERPLDISTFTKPGMVGSNEASTTYPQFFHSPAGDLIFMYRDGSSGSGNHIFNRYSTSTAKWSRLLGSPLTDGEGEYNAYPVGPVQGPDGQFHLVWVWRDTPDAATNHDLSYARTADLTNWKSAAGAAISLPIRLSTSDIVDPVPAGGGMINNNTKVGFDGEQRPVVAYHKFDANGNTQLYNARFENGKWVRYKTSDWTYRWAFGGQGTLVFEIEVEPVEVQPDGTLTQSYYHARHGGYGAFRLNPTTLAAEENIPRPTAYPAELATVQSPTAGMEVRWKKDAGAGPDPDVVYMLRWETLPSNRDQPRSTIPPATTLRLYGFRRK